MRTDYLTYRRAAGESVRGLVLQLAIALATLIYAVIGHDHAAMTAAAFMGTGVLAWLSLAVVFDQHRRERIEAIESEALAKSELGGTSVFEQQEDFLPAAKRLAGLYRFFVPAMSLLIAALLITFGVFRFMSGLPLVDPQISHGSTFSLRPGWAMGLGLLVSVLGFVFARYTAGMAKIPAYANLRAGSSYAVGAALLGLVMGIAHFIDLVGPDWLVRYLQVIYPAFMVLIGVETVIHILLGLYRPRKAGESPRPPFDSRLLGFLAAPDRIAESINEAINYQLGFDVTSGWFYKLLSRWLMPLAIMGVIIVWALSSIVVVQPHQRAIVLRFGKPVSDQELAPGAHFKMPWPIDTVYIPEYVIKDAKGYSRIADYTAKGLRSIDLGTAAPAIKDAILWTNDHAGEEVFQIVQASDPAGTSQGDTSDIDLALVSVEVPLQYSVKDVKKFDELAPPDKRDDLLKAVARQQMTLYLQKVALDDILGQGRADISKGLRESIQQAFDKLNAGRGSGVEVVFLGIVGVHPPKDTAAAFETPVMAEQRRQANIDDARAYRTEKLVSTAGDEAAAEKIVAEINEFERLSKTSSGPEPLRLQEIKVRGLIAAAGGSSAKTLAQSRADRWKTNMGTRGLSLRHAGQVAMYEAAPKYYMASMYFESLKAAMRDNSVYIVSDGVRDSRFDINLIHKDVGPNIFEKKE